MNNSKLVYCLIGRQSATPISLCRAFSTGLVFLLVIQLGIPDSSAGEPNRSPVDLAVSPDGSWLVTANQTSNSASLVRTRDGQILDEIEVGSMPQSIAISHFDSRLYISNKNSGDIVVLRVHDGKLKLDARIHLGFHPHGIAIAPHRNIAYVALTAADEVAVVDLNNYDIQARIDVGRWPRFLAVSPDGSRLAVGTSGDRGVTIVDTQKNETLYIEKFMGLNIGHMQISHNGKRVWFPWVIYRSNRISKNNIQMGWVLATRIGQVRLDGPTRREAISLDPQGEAVADPHGLRLTRDESQLVVSASGSQELLVYRATDLPFRDLGGTDHILPELLNDPQRFTRINLGGRPLGLRIAPDDQTVYVANYISNSVQVVDLEDRKLVREFDLGGPEQPSLARRGEAIFYDAHYSLDQWYSCHTCHYEGGSNSVSMDTQNDKSSFTFKTVPALYHLGETGPWTWHGWQEDLGGALDQSITTTMMGKPPAQKDIRALLAYVKSIRPAANPYRKPDGSLSKAARRGREVFQSERANCTSCHHGPHLTDGSVHDVGTGGEKDELKGYNTPTLIGLHNKVGYLHDGRVDTLEKLLNGPHSPERVSGEAPLNEEQLRDLIAYLKSL